ncbi:uncharacterized protein LOC106979711 isoform X3 [Acinonyx jubatus]|uniref:Uncharacterized protein LOC106979711 isoform X3 n=1 Tax=Acinonyx jubatus TaxID=32536 RepID=A0ABM3PID6_ACIJB|nr:uncharacterized protein LOC106979711 isoform X3 [Acinonyx jubatus]
MACPKDGMPLSPGSQNNGTNLKMTVIDKEYEEKESFLCVVTDLCVPAGEKENIQNHLQTWSFLSGGSCDLQTVNPRPHSPDAALCSFTRVAAFPTPPPARRRGSQSSYEVRKTLWPMKLTNKLVQPQDGRASIILNHKEWQTKRSDRDRAGGDSALKWITRPSHTWLMAMMRRPIVYRNNMMKQRDGHTGFPDCIHIW